MFAVHDMQVAWLEEMVCRLVNLPIADESPLIFLLIVAKISPMKSLIKSLVASLFVKSFNIGATGMNFLF